MTKWVITFPSVFHALRAEKLLKNEGFAVKLIPIPRELSGSCDGLAAQLDEASVPRAAEVLSAAGVEMVKPGVKIGK